MRKKEVLLSICKKCLTYQRFGPLKNGILLYCHSCEKEQPVFQVEARFTETFCDSCCETTFYLIDSDPCQETNFTECIECEAFGHITKEDEWRGEPSPQTCHLDDFDTVFDPKYKKLYPELLS